MGCTILFTPCFKFKSIFLLGVSFPFPLTLYCPLAFPFVMKSMKNGDNRVSWCDKRMMRWRLFWPHGHPPYVCVCFIAYEASVTLNTFSCRETISYDNINQHPDHAWIWWIYVTVCSEVFLCWDFFVEWFVYISCVCYVKQIIFCQEEEIKPTENNRSYFVIRFSLCFLYLYIVI